jgi:predicted ATPase/DNA-binding winged helix-turn-helix (wHTH) protein
MTDREGAALTFGPFRLFARERRLERAGAAVQLGSRAFDVLVALAARAGEVVSKQELAAYVWPDTVVEESGLRVHIAALRKALGDAQGSGAYISNIPGRGYCFVARVSRASRSPRDEPVRPGAEQATSSLPLPLTTMVGREDAVLRISSELLEARFLSIVGPGGMGKTTVAVAVCHALVKQFAGEARFVDLGSLSDVALVPGSVASAVGATQKAGDTIASLVEFLRDRRMLLVIDSCEHVIETVAPLLEGVFRGAGQVYILTTSRESLRVEGEHVHRLAPLDCPPAGSLLDAPDALTYSAVRLFVERAAASGSRVELSNREAPVVAEICRRLDGIALAIEFAAGRVEAYGIGGTASLLENRFKLQWQGRRTALPRHQTLDSMIDWSYSLLTECERLVLRRLAIFAGNFLLEAALEVVSDDSVDAEQVVDALGSLADKSLVSVDTGGLSARYRLLDTTRTYARSKLQDAGESQSMAERHAAYFCRALDAASARSEHLGNVRAALKWSFSEEGDNRMGVALAGAAAALFAELSLLGECYAWSKKALAVLSDADRGSRRELNLQAALGASLMFTRGNREEVQAALERAIALAEESESDEQQLRLLGGLDVFFTRLGEFRKSLEAAERSEAVARRMKDPSALVVADWAVGTSRHLLGNQLEAERRCHSALDPLVGRANTIHAGFDHRIRALVVLGRATWLLGRAESAMAVARRTIAEALALDHPVTVAISLVWTAPVFLWSGDLDSASEIIEQLRLHAEKHSLGPYLSVALGLNGELLIKRGELASGIDMVRRAMTVLRAERHEILCTVFATAMAEALGNLGQYDEALATIDEAIAEGARKNGSFDMPEMLRVKGQLLSSMPVPDRREAESWLLRSLECARRYDSLAWELRTATSLARLLVEQGFRARAQDALAPVYGKFTQGFETADLRAARALLNEL